MAYDDAAGPGGNVPEYSVAEISAEVRRRIQDSFGRIRVRGEVSSVSTPRSGHVYLGFKQDRHELAGVIWRSSAVKMREVPTIGVEYLATGKLTSYSAQSRYQLIIDRIEPAGEGALLAMLERRKARLQAEGLFDESRKKELPHLPGVIGVVSSPSGAVIQDIMHVLRDRFPRHVLLWPAAMQGTNCADEVARAIRGFDALSGTSSVPRPDLLIVARGGGSVEDLLGFSEENVVRAVADCEIPVISAVGHETDTPLIDLVADFRVPTPSVAAEKAVPVRVAVAADLASMAGRLAVARSRIFQAKRQRLRDIGRGLPRADALLGMSRQRLDHCSGSLPSALTGTLQRKKFRLALASERHKIPKSVTAANRRLAVVSTRLNVRLIRNSIDGLATRLELQARELSRIGAGNLERRRKRLDELDRLLNSLGYMQILKRGYAVVHGRRRILKSREGAASETEMELEFWDGRLAVRKRELR